MAVLCASHGLIWHCASTTDCELLHCDMNATAVVLTSVCMHVIFVLATYCLTRSTRHTVKSLVTCCDRSFIVTINVIALLKYHVFVLLISGLPFSGPPFSSLTFWSVIFRSANFMSQFLRLPYSGQSFSVAPSAYQVAEVSTSSSPFAIFSKLLKLT